MAVILGSSAPSSPNELPYGGHGVAWSPDGSRLAVRLSTGNDASSPIIRVIQLGGDPAADVDVGPPVAEFGLNIVGWSPTGDRIAWTADVGSGGISDGQGRQATSLPTEADGWTLGPPLAWSPDGRRMLFHGSKKADPPHADVLLSVSLSRDDPPVVLLPPTLDWLVPLGDVSWGPAAQP